MKRIGFIVRKEIRHILRDPRSLIIVIVMPMLMTLLFGYAVNLDTDNIQLGVIDLDQTPSSRDLVSSFYQSGYFRMALSQPTNQDPEAVFRSERAHAVLMIRPGFGAALRTGTRYDLGLVVDGSDANRAAAISNYSSVILMSFLNRNFLKIQPLVTVSQQVRYNPNLESSKFFVPGLIAIILMMISALLTSITIAKEKETGTMEQLLTSPVSPRQIIIGKVIPYVGIAILDGTLVILFAVFNFKVPMMGSILQMVCFGILYVIAALSLGVLISTIVKSQQAAMMAALMATVLPSVMLSGFIFEIKNMPVALQWFSNIVPARHFIVIIRGIMLKGSGLTVLWRETGTLVLLTLFLLAAATKKFKVKLG